MRRWKPHIDDATFQADATSRIGFALDRMIAPPIDTSFVYSGDGGYPKLLPER